MPKNIKPAPAFLQKKLDDKTNSFVRSNAPLFLASVKPLFKGKYPSALEVLPDFFAWLGDRDKRFRHLESGQLKTHHSGTYQVYNFLRKRMEKIEEITPLPVPSTTTRRDTTRTGSPGRPKRAKDNEDETVSIKATANFEGHHEEKETPYRRHMDSDQDETDPEVGDEVVEDESEEDKLADKPKFDRLRQMLTDIMAGFDEDELESLQVEHDFKEGTSCVSLRSKSPKP